MAYAAAFMAEGDQMGHLWKQGFEGVRSAMTRLVFFLEEPSAREMLKGLLPRLLPGDATSIPREPGMRRVNLPALSAPAFVPPARPVDVLGHHRIAA